MIEWKGRLLPVEVKAGTRPRLSDAKSLRVFHGEYSDLTLPGLLLHGGDQLSWLTEDVLAVPWWRVL